MNNTLSNKIAYELSTVGINVGENTKILNDYINCTDLTLLENVDNFLHFVMDMTENEIDNLNLSQFNW
jgi:hypothetical protein